VQGTATLQVRGPRFFSSGDEDVFFDWLGRIRCVEEVRGEGEALQVLFKSAAVSDPDLRELIAVFQRYRLDPSQLKQFLTAENAGWFRDDPQAYWHSDIFGRE
jgi:hypothetical protein